jgi:predicted O-methyltransferase YrrM
MAYHGYLQLVKEFLYSKETPTFLEIGVDNGASLVPLVVFLTRTKQRFFVSGIDVRFHEHLKIILGNIDLSEGQVIQMFEESSLKVLPALVEAKAKFDLLLIDGDHNYYTVAQELQYVPDLTHDHSMIIIDDYAGRWSDKDLWYSQRDGYQNVTSATTPVDTEKHGVKAAVDEFVAAHPEWKIHTPIPGEPVLLVKQ